MYNDLIKSWRICKENKIKKIIIKTENTKKITEVLVYFLNTEGKISIEKYSIRLPALLA